MVVSYASARWRCDAWAAEHIWVITFCFVIVLFDVNCRAAATMSPHINPQGLAAMPDGRKAKLYFPVKHATSTSSFFGLFSGRNQSVLTMDTHFCGDYTLACPSEAPICCGHSPFLYCVAAGTKCCSAQSSSIATNCQQGEECCASRNKAICCAPGTTCVLQRGAAGKEEPRCSADSLCASFGDADSCLHDETAQKANCGWCCAEQRCVETSAAQSSSAASDPPRRPTCRNGEAPIRRGEVCLSRCSYANTCTRCMEMSTALSNRRDAGGAQTNLQSSIEECTWCCATMTCMPLTEAVQRCDNYEYIATSSTCPGCMFNGTGTNEVYISNRARYYMLFGAIVLFAGVMGLFAMFCNLIYLFAGDAFTEPGEEQQVSAQEAVRRYGFTLFMPKRRHSSPSVTPQATTTPSVDITQARQECSLGGSETTATVAAMRRLPVVTSFSCSLCRRIVHLTHLQSRVWMPSTRPSSAAAPNRASHETGVAGGPDRPALVAARDVGSAGCAAGVMQSEAEDDGVVLLLPCNHMLCYPCLGVPVQGVLGSGPSVDSGVAVPSRETVNEEILSGRKNVTLPPMQLEDIEQRIRHFYKKKCPVCKTAVEDIVLTQNILSL